MARRPSKPPVEDENPPEELIQSENEDTSQDDSGSTDEQATPEPADDSPVPTQAELDALDEEAVAQGIARATESAEKFLKALSGYSDDAPDSFTIGGNYGKVFKLGDVKTLKPFFEAMVGDGDKPEITEAAQKAAQNFINAIAGYPEGVPDDRPVGGNSAGVLLFGDLKNLLPLFQGIVHDPDDDEDEDDGTEGDDA